MSTLHHTPTKRRIFLFEIVSLLIATSLACGLVACQPMPTNTVTSVAPTVRSTIPQYATSTPRPIATTTAETNTWTGIGPWINITALAIDPVTPGIIYAGTFGGGVFTSTNGGENWRAVNSDLGNLYIWELAIDPVTPAIIYAGTLGGGVFKSTNGGENWSAVNNGLIDAEIHCLRIDPVTPAILYVVTIPNGVFKSTNGGESWGEVNTGLADDNRAVTLEIDPVMPSTLYLGTYANGVFKSTNGGGNWSVANTGIDLNTAYENSVDQLVIDPVESTTLYAVTRYKGIFISTNGGQDWIAFETGLELADASYPTLWVDPITPLSIYIGTFWGELFKSTDGGKNWLVYNTGLGKYPIRALAVDPFMPTILYVGTYGGGVFTNQVNKTFAPVQMPSLTAPPSAPTESPLLTVPTPAEDLSSFPTETLSEIPTLVPLEIPFQVSGSLNFRKQIQLPENARVIVLWDVTAGYPDYGFIFGEGTIDSNNNSFEIVFDEPPPIEALNLFDLNVLGVGIVIITTDQTLESGNIVPESFSPADILGASGQYSIIFVNGNFESLDSLNWCNNFDQGYSAGKGIEIPNSAYDGFEPVDPTTTEIIIDDLEDIEFVEWS